MVSDGMATSLENTELTPYLYQRSPTPLAPTNPFCYFRLMNVKINRSSSSVRSVTHRIEVQLRNKDVGGSPQTAGEVSRGRNSPKGGGALGERMKSDLPMEKCGKLYGQKNGTEESIILDGAFSGDNLIKCHWNGFVCSEQR